jgi:hypothetical protein
MASELERKVADVDDERDERCGEFGGREGVRPGFVGGAIVSPPVEDWSSTSVASPLESSAVPHDGQ